MVKLLLNVRTLLGESVQELVVLGERDTLGERVLDLDTLQVPDLLLDHDLVTETWRVFVSECVVVRAVL